MKTLAQVVGSDKITNFITHVKKISTYTEKKLSAANYILQTFWKNGHAQPAQLTIAKNAGSNRRQTANGWVKEFHDIGLIIHVPRFKDTSKYYPGPLMFDYAFRSALSNKIPALRYFLACQLISDRKADTIYNINTQNTHDGGVQRESSRMSIEVKESYISPFVNEITEIQLNFGEKIQLSRYSQHAIRVARQRVALASEDKRTFAYFNGIAQRIHGARTASDNATKTHKGKEFAWRDGQLVNVADEQRDATLTNMASSQLFVTTHTSGNALLDYNERRRLGIHADRKSAEEEVIRLTQESVDIDAFVGELRELAQWKPIDDVHEIECMIHDYEHGYTEFDENISITYEEPETNTHLLFGDTNDYAGTL